MPLFKSPSQSSGRRESSASPPRGGLTSPKRRSISTSSPTSSQQNGSVRSSSGSRFFEFGRNNSASVANDPSIVAARQKVQGAEEAEKEADRALSAARAMVREARAHVKMLENEALEDAKRAKAKHAEAKIVSKSASGLGRHG